MGDADIAGFAVITRYSMTIAANGAVINGSKVRNLPVPKSSLVAKYRWILYSAMIKIKASIINNLKLFLLLCLPCKIIPIIPRNVIVPYIKFSIVE